MNSRNPCTGKCDWTGVVVSTQPTTGNVEHYPMCKTCGSFVVGSTFIGAQADYETRIRSALVEVTAVKGEPVRWEWCCFEDKEQRTGWQCEGHGDQKGWEKLAESNPAKYRIARRPLYTAPPAGAGMREALEGKLREFDSMWARDGGPFDSEWVSEVLAALTAPGATCKVQEPESYTTTHFDEVTCKRTANCTWPDCKCPRTAPGATTKSDGGQPIHAVKMPEYHYQELDMSGDHHGVTSNYGEYTPVTVRGSTSDPSSTRSDPNEQAYADLIASGGIFPEAYQQREPSMNDDQIKYMVDRFLMWNLPEHFSPDCGISFDQSYRSEHGPVGTNLFDAVQATAMVRHMLEGLPSTRSEVTVESIAQHVRRAIVNNYLPMQSMTREIIGDDAARALLDQFEIRRK